MDASASESEYVTALGSDEQHATSSCSEFVTTQIELSKRHWSELSEPIVDGISREEAAKAKLENKEAFKFWESHPEWRYFFQIFGDHSDVWKSAGSLEVGEKFAEGAQAELFHARVKWSDPRNNEIDLEEGCEYALKVFKEGSLVQDLQVQWPEGLFRYRIEDWKLFEQGILTRTRDICRVYCATLLEDGRFAFLMNKEDGDLRSLIERKMGESDNGVGPFSKEVGEEIMYRVAEGMDCLHSYNIIHRDLKASNVLVSTFPNVKWLYCYVADYESSIGVIGTGFWRAPEILRACREKNIFKTPELFTKEADSYSYGMTCYEVLTGQVPFEDHPLFGQHSLLRDLVIDEHLRPVVPNHVDEWARELLHWCWKPFPEERPSFKEILGILEANSYSEHILIEVSKRLGIRFGDLEE